MIENQQNKNLQQIRSEIDLIDNQIIELLKQRMILIPLVSQIKKNNREKFFIKSSREADMIKNLVNKVDNNFLKLAIIKIWRKIITVANMEEQIIKIGIHNPNSVSDYEYIVKDYYCEQVEINNYGNVSDLILAIQNSQINIAIFKIPDDPNNFEKKDSFQENWWINLANNQIGLKIYAKIPLVELNSKKKKTNINLIACAIKDYEKSIEDKTLICIELSENISKNQIQNWLNNNKIEAKFLKDTKLNQINGVIFYLLEIEGFFIEEDFKNLEFITGMPKPFIKILGHYPSPIVMEI